MVQIRDDHIRFISELARYSNSEVSFHGGLCCTIHVWKNKCWVCSMGNSLLLCFCVWLWCWNANSLPLGDSDDECPILSIPTNSSSPDIQSRKIFLIQKYVTLSVILYHRYSLQSNSYLLFCVEKYIMQYPRAMCSPGMSCMLPANFFRGCL